MAREHRLADETTKRSHGLEAIAAVDDRWVDIHVP